MTQAKAGDTVRLHYTGTLDDGTQFDSSAGNDPLEFTVGSGQIIPGLDKEVSGMAVGDKKTVTIEAEEAYGAHDPSRIQTVPREQIPPHIPTDPGTQLQMQTPQGQAIPVTVTAADDQGVTLDANHPLAGKALTFDVELVEIV
ncbi:peptidylprolyl isomerase [Pseudoruegeria sp. HB172150]|uniref:FKBP-type peptidyl-prolyl cis-trans isomerase n=1 Tax=Pseudoruegeria sp. HB172150 TaxID=2721164 RepID=UPI0015544568|nr:peptidylprolyl isomerase [Pseudoruegeria sp. HB172150]